MKLNITCADLQTAISDIKKSCGSVTHLNLNVSNKSVTVSATDKINAHIIRLKGVSNLEAGKCAIPISYLEGIIRNRKSLLLSLDAKEEGTLYFESTEGKKYSGDITVLPYEDIIIELDDDASTIELTEEQVNALTFTFNKALLPPTFETQTFLPVYVTLNKKGVICTCFDSYYMARCINPDVGFDTKCDVQLSGSTFNTISSASHGAPYTLSFTNSTIIAYNKAFRLQVPYGQSDSPVGLEQVNGLLNTLCSDEGLMSCVVDKEEFTTLFYNAFAFRTAQDSQPLRLTFNNKNLTVGVTSKQGSASESMECADAKNINAKKEHKVDMLMLNEQLGKIDTTSIPIAVSESALLIHYEHKDIEYTYVCGLV